MAELNANNYLNLIGYILNVAVTFGASSFFNFPDNAELSNKYQTIVTPAGLSFAIWGIIFLSQGFFAVLQMLSSYRSHGFVQEGVKYWYFVACVFQSIWTFAFGYEVIGLSFLCMGGIFLSLLPIVRNQSRLGSEFEEFESSQAISDFWVLKFPFSIHCGWIAAAFAVNANVFLVASGVQAAAQERWAYATVIYTVGCAMVALFYLPSPDFTIPYVLVWATMGIAIELKSPKDSIVNMFTDAVIGRVRAAVLGVCVMLAIVTTGYGIYRAVYMGRRLNSRSNETQVYTRVN